MLVCTRCCSHHVYDPTAAVDYKDPDFASKLLDACPNGVDVYFDNVGGSVSTAVLGAMNRGGRVPICGQIASYDDDVSYDALCGDEGVSEDLRGVLERRDVQRKRFTVVNYPEVRACVCVRASATKGLGGRGWLLEIASNPFLSACQVVFLTTVTVCLDCLF